MKKHYALYRDRMKLQKCDSVSQVLAVELNEAIARNDDRVAENTIRKAVEAYINGDMDVRSLKALQARWNQHIGK